MGFREFQEKLHEMQVNATGATGETVFALLSLPHATLSGLVNRVQGKSFNEAADIVVNEYATLGKKIGRDQSDLIVSTIKLTLTEIAKSKSKKETK